MDPNPLAIVVYQGNKIRDDLLDQVKLSYASSAEESELVQQHETISRSMIIYNPSLLHHGVVIDANPISYRLPDEPHMRTIKEIGSSPQQSTPNSRKRTKIQEEKLSGVWRIEAKQRESGRWDKVYTHVEEKIKCRSLKEVERFEKEGIRPKRQKGKKKEKITQEVPREIMDAREIQEREAAEHRAYVERFLADAYTNQQLASFLLNDEDGTPSPSTV